MNRKTDPEDFDAENVRSEDARLCSLHHKWLKELFVAIRGNGDVKHGLEYKVQILLDRQIIVARLLWLVATSAVLTIGKVVGAPLFEFVAKLVVNHR